MPEKLQNDLSVQDTNQAKGGDSNNQHQSSDITLTVEKGKKSNKKSKKSAIIFDDDIDEQSDLSISTWDAEEKKILEKQYDETIKTINEGETVKGTIVQINPKEVIVNIDFKSEGIIPISEFSNLEEIKVGDEVDVYVEKLENQDGLTVLSKQKADFVKVWSKIKEAHDNQEVVDGKVLRKIKGGLVVDVFGIDTFLPGSQVDIRQVPNMDELLGKTLKFKIIKLNKRRRNIVVSRRLVLEEERESSKQNLVSNIEVGQVVEGTVKNITDFGVFIDLGGLDGLLHITDLSWGRISHPSEVVHLGQKIKVKVLEFDKEKERISLGLKQLIPYPWENAEEKYKEGTKVKGKVVSITDYGAFVELEKGVEGLIHISEMSWTKRVRHPKNILTVGSEVEAVVLKLDKENEKVSLGLKQLEEDPWNSIDSKYPIGSRVTGKVRNVTSFGTFVELEEGIDGLIHISDMSWTKRIKHPNELMKKGDVVEVVVLGIDKPNHRISLGLKQLNPDPWIEVPNKYPVGTKIEGKVSRLLENGVILEIGDEGVEGFIPISHLTREEIKKIPDSIKVGDVLTVKVLQVNPSIRKMVLSVKACEENIEETFDEQMEEYEIQEEIPPIPPANEIIEDNVEEENTETNTDSTNESTNV